MDALVVSCKECRFVGHYLLETGKSKRWERGARRHVRRNVNGFASCDRGVLAGQKFIAALRLAFDGKFAGCRACDRSRELEQTCSVASLQLELCLAQRQRAVAGIDFAAIDRQCDVAVLACKRIARALHASFEHRAQLLAQFLDSQWFECRCICAFQVRPAFVDSRFPFAAFDQASIIRLDGLNIAIAGAPDAQRQSTALKFQTLGVEVDRALIFASLRPGCPAEQGYAPKPREIRGWQLQLDFDFLRRRHELLRMPDLDQDMIRWKRFPLFRIMRQNLPIRQEPQRFPALRLQIFGGRLLITAAAGAPWWVFCVDYICS